MSYTSKKVVTILEKEIGDVGSHLYLKTCEEIGVDPQTVGADDLIRLLGPLTERVAFFGKEKAARVYEKVEKIVKKTGVKMDIEKIIAKAEAAKNAGKTKDVLGLLLPELNTIQNAPPEQKIRFHSLLGDAFLREGDKEKSKKHYDLVLGEAKKLGDEKRLAEALQGLGMVYWRMGKYPEAKKALEDALRHAEKTDDHALVGRIYMALANVHDEWGQVEKALEYSAKSREHLIKGHDKKSLATLYNNMGVVYARRELFHKSLEYYQQCVEIAREIGYHMMEGWALFNAAEDLARMKKYEEALEHCKRSEEIFTNLRDKLGLSGVYMSYAITYWLMGDMDRAEKYFQKTVDLRKKLGMPYRTADALYEMGRFYMEKQDLKKAKKALEESLKIFTELGNTERSAQVQQALLELQNLKQ